MRIGVIGAGVSGLTASRYLAHLGHEVHCFEASSRTGGWIQSQHRDSGAFFEAGPHSWRPRKFGNGLQTLKLVLELGLQDDCEFSTCRKVVSLLTFVLSDTV